VNAEFNWWILMVGLVVGAGLVWFVLSDQRRREVDIETEERAREALWLSATLADEGEKVSPEVAERLLALHRAYLEAPPPDEADDSGAAGEARPTPPPPPGRSRSELAAEDRGRVDRGAADIGE
jgi:hypothetical protein